MAGMLGQLRKIAAGAPRTASVVVSLAVLAAIALLLAYGRDWFRLDDRGEISRFLVAARNSHAALAGVVGLYCLLATIGFPQVVLFFVTMAVFGAETGAVYAWIGTMVSAALTFFLGRALGGAWVGRWGGARVQQSMEFLGRHGVLASGLIRIVPSAPFIVVNAAAGAARIPLWKYALGTGVGIVPKIALVAAIAAVAPEAGDLQHGLKGLGAYLRSWTAGDVAAAAAIIAVWIGLGVAARRWYLRVRRRDQKY